MTQDFLDDLHRKLCAGSTGRRFSVVVSTRTAAALDNSIHRDFKRACRRNQRTLRRRP